MPYPLYCSLEIHIVLLPLAIESLGSCMTTAYTRYKGKLIFKSVADMTYTMVTEIPLVGLPTYPPAILTPLAANVGMRRFDVRPNVTLWCPTSSTGNFSSKYNSFNVAGHVVRLNVKVTGCRSNTIPTWVDWPMTIAAASRRLRPLHPLSFGREGNILSRNLHIHLRRMASVDNS